MRRQKRYISKKGKGIYCTSCKETENPIFYDSEVHCGRCGKIIQLTGLKKFIYKNIAFRHNFQEFLKDRISIMIIPGNTHRIRCLNMSGSMIFYLLVLLSSVAIAMGITLIYDIKSDRNLIIEQEKNKMNSQINSLQSEINGHEHSLEDLKKLLAIKTDSLNNILKAYESNKNLNLIELGIGAILGFILDKSYSIIKYFYSKRKKQIVENIN
jgi:hypothetical protein